MNFNYIGNRTAARIMGVSCVVGLALVSLLSMTLPEQGRDNTLGWVVGCLLAIWLVSVLATFLRKLFLGGEGKDVEVAFCLGAGTFMGTGLATLVILALQTLAKLF